MKKRILLALLILTLVLSLSSCIRMETSVKVHLTGSYDIKLLYAFSDELGADAGGLSEDDIEEYEDKGYKVKEYEEDGYSGYIISKNNCKSEDTSSDSDDSSYSDSALGAFSDLEIEGGTITLDYEMGSDYNDISQYMSYIKKYDGFVKLNVTLPFSPDEHNATSVSNGGRTLTWDMTDSDFDGRIYFKFSIVKAIIKLVLIVAAVILVLIFGIKFLKKAIKHIKASWNVPEPDAQPFQNENTASDAETTFTAGTSEGKLSEDTATVTDQEPVKADEKPSEDKNQN